MAVRENARKVTRKGERAREKSLPSIPIRRFF